MPQLDFANPVYKFTPNSTYTAVDTCYLCGSYVCGGASGLLSINDNKLIFACGSSSQGAFPFIPPIKLKAGDVVKITDIDQYSSGLAIYNAL